MIFVGVDPGASGAIASITKDGRIIAIDRFDKAETDGRISLIVADHLATLVASGIVSDSSFISVAIERVSAMPGQGVSTMFAFGRAYGEAIGALHTSRVRLQLVTPATWQRDLGAPKRENPSAHKRTLREIAETTFGRKFVMCEADAALLAEWNRRHGNFARPDARSGIG